MTQNSLNLARNCLIIPCEGYDPNPYVDLAGRPTIGIGSTIYQDGSKVTMVDKPISEIDATNLMEWHLNTNVIPAINGILTPLNDFQNASLCSLIYNIGYHAFISSTLLSYLNSGVTTGNNLQEVWLMWNKSRIKEILKPVPELTNRRQWEFDIFTGKIPVDENSINFLKA